MAKEFKIYNGCNVDNKDVININNLEGQSKSLTLSEIRSAHNTIGNNVSQSNIDLIENNIMLNAFRIASEESLSIFNLVDGIADEFENEDGIDLATGQTSNQVYNGGGDYYSPTQDATVKLLLHLDGSDGATSTTDASPSAHSISFFGTAQLDTAEKKFGTASLLLDGSTDYISAPDNADWDIFANTFDNYTIHAWVKINALSGNQAIFSQAEVPPNDYYYLFVQTSTGKIFWQHKIGGSVTNIGSTSTPFTDTNWHHVALVIKGSNHGVYVDGVQVIYGNNSNTATIAAPLRIGSGYITWGEEFNGNIDEFIFEKADIFSADPVVGLTDTITVPTAPSSATNNMTLISESFTAEAQPEIGRIVIAEEEIDSLTINIDLKGYVSRDDGTTWEEVTLEDVGGIEGNKRVLVALYDFPTGTPSGTDMRYKIETLNGKNIKIHSAGMFWE